MQEKITPWYKEPYMILVIGLPILSVIGGFTFLYFAASGQDTLVSDSYYKDGVSYTEDRLFDNNAKQKNITAKLLVMGNVITVNVSADQSQVPEALLLQLIHPTLKSKDINLMLVRTGKASFSVQKPLSLPARWKLWLSSQSKQWRVRYNGWIEPQQYVELKSK